MYKERYNLMVVKDNAIVSLGESFLYQSDNGDNKNPKQALYYTETLT